MEGEISEVSLLVLNSHARLDYRSGKSDHHPHRSDDLSMASMFNSCERTADDWKTLLSNADSRFVMKGVKHPRGSALAVIEVAWKGALVLSPFL